MVFWAVQGEFPMPARHSIALLLAFASAASAQKVSGPILIYAADPGHYCVEATIAASIGGPGPANANRVACAFVEADSPNHSSPDWYRVRYATTADGWVTRFTELLPLADCALTKDRSTDPMCAPTSAGEFLIGSLSIHFPEGSGRSLTVGVVPPSSASVGTTQALQCQSLLPARWDKGWLASGPSSLVSGETRAYLLYSFIGQCGPCPGSPLGLNRLVGVRSIGSANWGTSVPEIEVHHNGTDVCDVKGQGALPLVIPGGVHKGRVVLPFRQDLTCPNITSVAAVLYSDTECLPFSDPTVQVWQPPAPILLDHATNPSGAIEVITHELAPGEGEDFLLAGSVDPNHPDFVYVIFPGRILSQTAPPDLFVARSVDGGNDLLSAERVG
jgi:hypothetical protein